MLDDIRFALRLVRKNAGLSVAAALLLALGLGGNSAVFALIYLVFERPLPGVHDAGQLVFAGMKDNQREWQSLSYPFYKELRDRNEVFRETAVLDFACFHVADAEGDDRRAEKLCGRIASWNVFDVLGTKMALGRTFRKDEDEVPGRDAVAILSHRVWQRRWNGDPAIVGRKIALNGHSFTILGITDPSFGGPFVDSYDDVWIPVAMAWPTFRSGRQTLEDQGLNRFLAIGRLKAGVKMEEAGAHLATLGRAVLGEAGRDTRNKTFALEAYSPIGPGVPGEFRLFLGVLLGVAGIALLVVCANIANLLIARSTARQRELAIRLAVGASRTRVVRQMLTEGLVLALLGGVPGVVVCIWCAELLPKLFPPAISGAPFEIRVPVDGPVLLYAALLCGVSALAFALPAAIKGARPDLASSLKAGEPDATPRRIRLRDTLAVAQIALCLSLLVIAGLLSGSFNKLRTSDPKMRVDGLLLASVEPALNGYTGARLEDLLERMHERVAATPGVESASMGMVAPFAGNDHDAGPVIGGDKPDGMRATFNIVGPDYFRTLDIALLRGREFRLDDRRGRPRVAIINETFARRMWPKDDPLGQTFRLKGSTGQPLTVVGVARDSIYVDAKGAAGAHYYQPFTGGFEGLLTFLVRTQAEPLALAEGVRTAVRSLDPNLPVSNVKTMRVQMESSLWLDRLGATIVSLFGIMAALVATIGLYAVMAAFVAQRTREIGIRMALGAQARDILAKVLKRGGVLTGIGLLLGALISLGATRVLQSLLYGVTTTDVTTFSAASALLLATAVAACWIPARKASRVDPMVSLRHE